MDDFEKEVRTVLSQIENSSISSMQDKYELRINYLERQARSDELVVSGVPKKGAANLGNISQNICKAI